MNDHRGTRRIDDAALDAALGELMRVESRPRLRHRVAARLGERPETRRAFAWPARVAAPAAALATILAAFWIAQPGERQPSLPAATAPPRALALPLPVPGIPDEPRQAPYTNRSTRVGRAPAAASWHAALPPLEQPSPLGIDPIGAASTVTDPIVIEPLAIDSLRIETLD
jgi:hypothetical protein